MAGVQGYIDQVCEDSGTYVCSICGHRQYFQVGETFTVCEECNDWAADWTLEA